MWYIVWAVSLVGGSFLIVVNAARMEMKGAVHAKNKNSQGGSMQKKTESP